MPSLFTSSLRPKLHALAVSFVPEISLATASQWSALEAAVDRVVWSRPPRVRRQLTSLIHVIDWAARIRYGRGLDRLQDVTRGRLLATIAVSRIALLRRGIWGLRTLVMLGWYTQPEVAASLGYRASPAGWSARR